MTTEEIEHGFELLGINLSEYKDDVDPERIGMELAAKRTSLFSSPACACNGNHIMPNWGFYA